MGSIAPSDLGYPRPQSAGPEVVNLATGDPGLPTPSEVVEAATRRLQEGDLKYSDVHGTEELRSAVQQKFHSDNALKYGLDQIAVSSGSKQVIANALMSTLNLGDEVVVPAPFFSPYPRIVSMAGGVPVVVSTGPDFKLTPETLQSVLSTRTRWILLNTPANPSGAVYSREELVALGRVVADWPEIGFISDEVYEYFTYDDYEHVSIASLSDQLHQRTLTVNGVSKAFSMTGWRLGYAGGPTELITAMRRVQHSTTTCPSALGQIGALAALRLRSSIAPKRQQEGQAMRDQAENLLSQVPGLTWARPAGAIYAYVDCSGVIGCTDDDGQVLETDVDVGWHLYNQGRVLVMPGRYYGSSPFLRLTFVIDPDDFAEGANRIKTTFDRLSAKRKSN